MKKETPVLKYAAILMIVFGAVEAAVGISGFFEISALHEAAAELQLANPIPVLITSGIFTMLIAVSELIAGILGYFYRARPAKAAACLVCGFISLSLAVLSDGYALFFYPAGRSYSAHHISCWRIPASKTEQTVQIPLRKKGTAYKRLGSI